MKQIERHFIILFVLILLPTASFSADYKVAVRAHLGLDSAIKQWQSTIDVISKNIPQHTFSLLPIISLKEITQRAGRGEFDFVLTNPSSFIELNELYGAEVIATLNNKRANTAQNQFGGVIFTHVRNDDILSIADLEDKTLMAVSEYAFGGWQVAWMEMLEQNFDPITKIKKIMFAKGKTQQEVVHAVNNGVADAGVVRSDLLERMEAEGKIDLRYFRIISNKDIRTFPFFLSTKLYPEWAFSVMKSVPAEHALEVKKALLAVKPDSQAASLGKYVGWVEPADYSQVRKLLKKLKVDPFSSQ